MARRSKHLFDASADAASTEVIQVISRAFDILRCFDAVTIRLGNREIAERCKLPRSTVSRLTLTLTNIGQLIYLPIDQKYCVGPRALSLADALRRTEADDIALADGRAQSSAHISRS